MLCSKYLVTPGLHYLIRDVDLIIIGHHQSRELPMHTLFMCNQTRVGGSGNGESKLCSSSYCYLTSTSSMLNFLSSSNTRHSGGSRLTNDREIIAVWWGWWLYLLVEVEQPVLGHSCKCCKNCPQLSKYSTMTKDSATNYSQCSLNWERLIHWWSTFTTVPSYLPIEKRTLLPWVVHVGYPDQHLLLLAFWVLPSFRGF